MTFKKILSYIQLVIFAVSAMIIVGETFLYYRSQSQLRQLPVVVTPPPSVKSFHVSSFIKTESLDLEAINEASFSFLGSTPSAQISKLDIYELKYEILGNDQLLKPITAMVYVPNELGSFPLFIFGAGTTGIADKCAPSLENAVVENLGNYANHLIAQAGQGYVGVIADYEGYHDPLTTEAYFISESEAKVLLGAILSLNELQTSEPVLNSADLSHVFLAGYSQGGHAAISAAREWQKLGTGFDLKGVIQYAGADDIAKLFNDSPWLAPYLVASYKGWYGPRLEERVVLQDRWLEEMDVNNEKFCVNEAYSHYPHDPSKMYAPAFLDALQSGTWPNTLTYWDQAIRLNSDLTNLPRVPYLFIQGGNDPIVTPKTARENVATLCQEQSKVLYQEYPGVDHFRIRQAGFNFSNQWMKDVLENQTFPSSCPPSSD